MTAKKLASILLQNPDAIVMHNEYTGGDTPCLEINEVIEVKKNQMFMNDGGNHITGYPNGGKAKKDLIILVHNTNKKISK